MPVLPRKAEIKTSRFRNSGLRNGARNFEKNYRDKRKKDRDEFQIR